MPLRLRSGNTCQCELDTKISANLAALVLLTTARRIHRIDEGPSELIASVHPVKPISDCLSRKIKRSPADSILWRQLAKEAKLRLMRPRIGDMIEIKTSKGLTYALYTHKHDDPPKYGALIRVFSKVFPERPDDLQVVTSSPVQFTTFFPLGAAVKRGLVQVVGNIKVPDALKPFPLFRVAGLMDPATKKAIRWGLWNGERSWRTYNLTPEQRKLPILGVWNDTLLVERIESGWRPERDLR